ncbi:MAG: hypothetical protein ACLQME_10295 [Alphaproteobacteria bacterium]
MAENDGRRRAGTFWRRPASLWRWFARNTSALLGDKYVILLLISALYAAFVISAHAKYYAPLMRGGTDAYDIYVNAYNVLYDNSISYSFLPGILEQDVDHPRALPQEVYVRGPFSQRFIGAAVLELGFAKLRTFFLTMCLGFCAVFIAVVYNFSNFRGYFSWSRGYAAAMILIFLYTLCDRNGLVMFLNPNRSLQFASYYLTLVLFRRALVAQLDWRAYAYTAVSFFLIWQCELVSALFCSLAFAFSLFLAVGIGKSWKAVVAAVCGASASLSLFIFQLVSYRGLSIFRDILSTMGERNTVLYYSRPRFYEGAIPDHVLSEMFRNGNTPARYDVPVGFLDFARHFYFVVTGRYQAVSMLLAAALLLAVVLMVDEMLLSGTLFHRLGVGRKRGAIYFTGRFYLASLIAFFACAISFRGFLAYMYMVFDYPMLCMVFTCGLAFLSLVVFAVCERCLPRRGWRYIAPLAFVGVTAFALFDASADRAENALSSALPGGAEALRAVADLGLTHEPIGINMQTYVHPGGRYPAGVLLGLTGRPGVYVPTTQAETISQNYPELRYYLCLDQPDCWHVLPAILRNGGTVVAKGADYILFELPRHS